MSEGLPDVPWPSERCEQRPVDGLVPYARNARTHSPEQVAQLAASIREFGWTGHILIDDAGTVIAGHGRLLAARQLGLESVPVMVCTGWSDAKRRAYTIADNKLAMNAGWDAQLLAVELDELSEAQWDMHLLGFAQVELDELIGTPHFDPATADEQGKLDSLAEKIVTCPYCAKSFDANALPES